jgi:hypothetical protein
MTLLRIPYFWLFLFIGSLQSLAAMDGFGVGTHWNEAKHWHLLKKAGVGWLRFDLSWYHFEANQGVFGNTEVDKAMRIADSLDLKVVAILGYSPAWAASGGSRIQVPQKQHLPAWYAYLDSVVSRYRSFVDAWEIWNEPDHNGFFQSGPGSFASLESPGGSPVDLKRRDYAVLQTESIKRLREKFGPGLVLTSSGFALGGSDYDADFLADLNRNQQAIVQEWQVLSIHGYGYPGTARILDRIRIAQEYKQKNPTKQVWLTEHGVTGYSKQNISPEQAGAFLVRNYARALSQGIDKVFWFRLLPGKDYATLIDKSGNPTPMLGIYTRLIQHWTPAGQAKPWTGDSKVEGATAPLNRKTNALILWSKSGETEELDLPGIQSARDIFGNPRQIHPLVLNASPLFITQNVP